MAPERYQVYLESQNFIQKIEWNVIIHSIEYIGKCCAFPEKASLYLDPSQLIYLVSRRAMYTGLVLQDSSPRDFKVESQISLQNSVNVLGFRCILFGPICVICFTHLPKV